MSDPHEGHGQAWGPGTLEEFAYATGQTDEQRDPIRVFEWFIKRNVDTRYHGHLLDTDDNDGQTVRDAINEAIQRAYEKGVERGLSGD